MLGGKGRHSDSDASECVKEKRGIGGLVGRGTVFLDWVGWIGSAGIEEEPGGGQVYRARGAKGIGCVAPTGAPGLVADTGRRNEVNIDRSLYTVTGNTLLTKYP